jgi:predicted outer membrane repeat protein
VCFDNAADAGGAAYVGGGALSFGLATFKSCSFARNRAATRGGAIRAVTSVNLPARVWLYNSVVRGNQAPGGRSVSGRVVVASCDVQGADFSPQYGNLSADPGFVDLDGGDLRLAPGSPCADAGDNGLAITDYLDLDGDGDLSEPAPYDLDGNPRFLDDPLAPDTGTGTGPLIDMGAYERPGAG